MSDTPRTDQAYEGWILGEQNSSWMEFARELERELDKREKQLIETQSQLITRNAELMELREAFIEEFRGVLAALKQRERTHLERIFFPDPKQGYGS